MKKILFMISLLFVVAVGLVACGGGGSSSGSSPTLVSIQVTPPANTDFDLYGIDIPQNTIVQLEALGTYSDNTTRDLTSSVTWTYDVGYGTTVSSTGLIQNQTLGSSIWIYATQRNITGKIYVSVIDFDLSIAPTNQV